MGRTEKIGGNYARLSTITTKIGSGATPRGGKESYKTEGISLIRSLNVHNFVFKFNDLARIDEYQASRLNNVTVSEKDILLNITGASVCRCCMVPPSALPARVNQHVAIIRLNPELADPHYVLYTINSQSFKDGLLNISMTGATREALTKSDIERFRIPLPPLPDQRKIAAILTAYDDLIETNKRRIALLEKMAEELYREWFVRMRFPGHQNTKFVKGVPEGWEQKRFGEFCMLKRGYDLPNALVEDGPYPVVASTSVKTFHKHYKVEPPVITTGRSGSLGDVLMTHSRAWPLNTTLYVRKFFGNSPYLVYYTLKNMGLEKFNSGAGVPTLNRNHVNGIPMAVPDKNLQRRFEEFVEPLHTHAESLRIANLTLTQTRDLLLPRLISGKLSLEDLNIQFPPSMQEEAAEPEPAHA